MRQIPAMSELSIPASIETGLQNGAQDGIGLVNPDTNVEFYPMRAT